MSRKLFLGLLLFSIILNFFPREVVAQVQLSERDSNYLLNSAQQGLIDEWIRITASPDFSQPEKQAALYLARNSIQQKQLNYALEELPKEFLEKLIKLAVFLHFSPDASTLLNKIEKESVEKAIDLAMNWLLENEIRVNSGKLIYSFTSYKGNHQEPVFYYNLAYHFLDEKNGELVIEIYSPNEVIPQKPTVSALSIKRSSWDFISWRAKGNEKIEPFIVKIKGRVSKEAVDRYSWKETLEVDVSFPDSMPAMPEIVPVKPFIARLPIIGNYYQDWQNRLQRIGVLINKVTGSQDNEEIDEGKSVGESIRDIGSKIKSFFSKVNPFSPASIVQAPLSDNTFLESTSGSIRAEDLERIMQFAEKGLDGLQKNIADSLLREVVNINSLARIAENQEKLDSLEGEVDKFEQRVEELVELIGILEEEREEIEKALEIEQVLKEEEGDVEEFIDEEKDDLGETILCNKKTAIPKRKKVIINEVAWMGTEESYANEWIELKNISGKSVDLGGWQLLNKNDQIKVIFGEGETIPAGGFYLLERTSDDSVPSVTADLIYAGALKNKEEGLYLFDNNCNLEDRVVADPDWPAGDNTEKRSMERGQNLSWHTYHELVRNGILGTPKEKNSFPPVNISFGPATVPKPEEQLPSSDSLLPLNLIITEIKIQGEENNYDFIELYNPNTTSVNVSGFQLKKRSSSGEEYSIRLFPEGNIVGPNNYFLWMNSDYASSSQLSPDVVSGQELAKDNSVALLDKDKNIIDAVGWGSSTSPFVMGEVFPENPGKNESLGRKWNSDENNYQNQGNNKEDFEIQIPTPRETNKTSLEVAEEVPVAVFDWEPKEVFINQEVFFNAASSSAFGSQIDYFIWNLGEISTTTNKATTTHIFSSSTDYFISLIVVDDKGSTSSPATTSLEVKEKPSFLKIEPLNLVFEIEEGDVLENQLLIIRNEGEDGIEWLASVTCSTSSVTEWIDLSPVSEIIQPNNSSTIDISFDVSSLEAGEYNATATIESSGEELEIPISLTILELPESILSVVINEIAWAGTRASANHEWIELYNNTDEEVDLEDWQIKSSSGTPNINLSGMIPANGYFLLERTDDQTISDVEADQIYTGALGNQGERLKLIDADNVLIDLVDFSDDWPAGRNRKVAERWIRMSMERVDPQLSGSEELNWVTNNGFNIAGKDADGNYVLGTPGQKNSRYKFYSSDNFYGGLISWDVIWTKKGNPYLIKGKLTISEGSMFIIEPGVEVELKTNADSRIEIKGTLKAGERNKEQVVFTSNREKEGSPGPGNWRYFHFTGPDSVLENVAIKYGGWFNLLPLSPYLARGAVTVENTDIIIRDSVFDSNLVAGVWLINSNSLIENTLFKNHNKRYHYTPRVPGKGMTVAIYLESSNPNLINLTFEENEVNIHP